MMEEVATCPICQKQNAWEIRKDRVFCTNCREYSFRTGVTRIIVETVNKERKIKLGLH